MKFTVATVLVIASLVSAEPPRFRNFARQTAAATTSAPAAAAPSAPYAPSGWRPAGAQFNLPQQSYGAPSPTYGPPVEPTGTETTTETTTEQYSEKAENIQHIPNKKPAKIQAQQNPVYFILPQRENLIYAVPQSAPLVAVPEANILTSARLQALPLSNAIFSPVGGSYVQIYQ